MQRVEAKKNSPDESSGLDETERGGGKGRVEKLTRRVLVACLGDKMVKGKDPVKISPDNPTKHLLLEGEDDSVSSSNKR